MSKIGDSLNQKFLLLQTDVRTVKSDVESLKSTVNQLKATVDQLNTTVDKLASTMVSMAETMDSIVGDFKKFNEEQTVISYRQIDHSDRLEKLETKVFGISSA